MKSRLAAGICKRNIPNAVSLRSIVSFLDRSFQARGFESSSSSLHSSAIEDDDFSELGPEIPKHSTKPIKLVTEKRFAKTDSSKKEVARKPLSSNTRPKIKDIVSTIGRASPTSNPKIGGHNHISNNSTDNTKRISNTESPRSVSIKNIVSTVGLSELVEAISVFGKVTGASFVNASNGLRCCNIEFENVDSSRGATLAGKITVGGQVFSIHPVDGVDVIAVRIKNINKETTDYAIHSRCKSVGELVGLARTSKDAVDAFFNVPNDTIHQSLLKTLNSTVVDLNNWSAHALTSNSTSPEASSDQEDRYNVGLQIFDELKKQLTLKKVHLDDLEALNASIMHLQGLPHVTNLSVSK